MSRWVRLLAAALCLSLAWSSPSSSDLLRALRGEGEAGPTCSFWRALLNATADLYGAVLRCQTTHATTPALPTDAAEN